MKKVFLLVLVPKLLFSHQNGIDCRDKTCRTMVLTPISFSSNGKRVGGNVFLEGDKETFAKWKFVIPEGYPLDKNISLGRPYIVINIRCNVYEKNLTSATWPSPYSPVLSVSIYNPGGEKTPPLPSEIFLIDGGKNKIITSQIAFVDALEEKGEVEITLERKGKEGRIPTIVVNKDSMFIGYIFAKEKKVPILDKYELNNSPSSATLITEPHIEASIWDGIPVKPFDVDWYKFNMEVYGSFKIKVSSSDERSKMNPSLRLYDKNLKLLGQSKGVKTASVVFSGKGEFFIEVSNSISGEGPTLHNYILSIENGK